MLEASVFPFAETSMVRLAPPIAVFSLSVFKNAEANLNAALGVTLPRRPELLRQAGITYLWSGPGSWLVLGADADSLKTARQYAAITDQSDGRIVLMVKGPQVLRALSKLVPIDLADDIFPEGATALTLAGHINVQLWREPGNCFALACFRGFATALYEALIESCLEFES